MQYEEMVASVADSLDISKGTVDRIYRAYWRAIREYIKALPLKQDWTEEEFTKLRPNVNIPSLGKFYVNYNRYKYLREKNKELEKLKAIENVED